MANFDLSFAIPKEPTKEQLFYLINNFRVDILEGKVYSSYGYLQEVGHTNSHGYFVISGLRNKKHLRSHIIWWSHYGKWPKTLIDHDNTNKQDDRIDNLKSKTVRENNANQYKTPNRKYPTGVSKMGGANRYETRIGFRKRMRFLGTSATPEEAGQKYLIAKERIQRLDNGKTIEEIRAMGLTEEEWISRIINDDSY